MMKAGFHVAPWPAARSAHPVVVLLSNLTQFAFEIDFYLKIKIAVVPRVLMHRKRACDLLEFLYLCLKGFDLYIKHFYLIVKIVFLENTNASTTEKESEQLSPIVDSGATVADDEKSNVEDLSSIFGDFDKEQSTSTASTSSKIICLFCDRSQKRCGKKLINLTFPSSDKVPQQIKDMAKNFGDLEILSKLQHQTIAYHLPCYAVYQSKEKRSMEESTDSSYSKYRQLHQLAFQSISNFIETEIIENNKVMYLAQLFLRYQALLLEFGNYEIDFDDIQDYRSETLQKKLIRKFGDRITIEASTAIRNKNCVQNRHGRFCNGKQFQTFGDKK
ncbi:hypothetical protein HF086_008032 [Spodoptera exigua]|uniref:Uncharacterized protein n=1 Tax=Spodoptera exigua TaxID=7107 RepID=A0A922SA15_SPOEX|nr:hypothetical protein HF086_008032 [Spodoptera exigua]